MVSVVPRTVFTQLSSDVGPTLLVKCNIRLGVSWVASPTGRDGMPLAHHSLTPPVFLYGVSIAEIPAAINHETCAQISIALYTLHI